VRIEQAQGVLVAVLRVLAGHYGYGDASGSTMVTTTAMALSVRVRLSISTREASP
jgi:hypothetical protein